jgi:ribose/xylose/arabinose/galactoside ABC-type transport system permease subunit
MVLTGLALAQIPNSATLALRSSWVSVVRAMALAVALLRGGLQLEFAVSDNLCRLAARCVLGVSADDSGGQACSSYRQQPTPHTPGCHPHTRPVASPALQAVWRLKLPAVVYCLLPAAATVAVITGTAIALVRMPPFLAIAFGFIMNAVSASIIVAVTLPPDAQGYGIKNGV